MPTVPRYDELQVGARALPGFRQESVASPELFGQGADKFVKIGKSLTEAGADGVAVAANMQDRENADQLFQVETGAKDALVKFSNGQRSKLGAAALADGGVTKQTDDWFAENTPKFSGDLKNDLQRKLFGQTMAKMRTSTLDVMSRHEADQSRISLSDSATASIAGSINIAAANADQWGINRPQTSDLVVSPDDPNTDKSKWPKRADGSDKGYGYLGLLKRPDGGVSSEISVGVEINGKETEIPTMVPTLTRDEVNTLLNLKLDGGGNIPDSIVNKATDFAKQRIAAGKDPFASASESPTVAGPAYSDPVLNAKQDVVSRVAALAKINGWGPERQQFEQGKQLTTLHQQVIQQLAVTDPSKAKVYFESNKNEIDGAQRAEIGEFADKATATSLGDNSAGLIFDKNKPKNSTEPMRLADMEDQLRSALKGNDTAIEKGLAGLKERAAAYEYQKKQEGNALESSVNQLIINGGSTSSVMKSPEFLSLSAKDAAGARNVMTYMQNRDASRASQGAANESRAYAAEARQDLRLHRDTLDTALRMSDPNKLMSMTRDEVINQLPILGSASTQALLQRWDAFTKNGTALSEAKIDNDQFNVFAAKAGLDITPGSNDVKKEQLIDLRNKVETIIGNEQQSKKRLLTRTEKDDIMNKEIDNKVMQQNLFGFNKPVPAIVLPQSDYANAYVEVPVAGRTQRIKLSDIPVSFRRDAVIARQRQGLPTDEMTIAKLYLISKGTTGIQ